MKHFGEPSEELERQGRPGHNYLVGRPALVAGYGRKRSTDDVDAKISRTYKDLYNRDIKRALGREDPGRPAR
ncbi:MAG: hypothetical protein OXG04_19485 [Acidobacteria bacterium]|nr:hypothetical protein [Acidobacteriota bacterium]